MAGSNKFKVLYFLEDRGHSEFITALTKKIISEVFDGVEVAIIDDVRSANPIKSHESIETIRTTKNVGGYKNFLKDLRKSDSFDFNAFVIVMDGNCNGVNKRVKELSKHVKSDDRFYDMVVYGVPDPHIEKWYVMDVNAFKSGVGLDSAPVLPPEKCERNYYKKFLTTKISDGLGSVPSLGGAEYAEDIVNNIDSIHRFAQLDKGCNKFINDLRALAKRVKKEWETT
ncbi:MAG: hypothetical protein HQ568_04530 [Calditrichaeota bacterium]|nr:hypothetical protein [Calditrichota bacterium]